MALGFGQSLVVGGATLVFVGWAVWSLYRWLGSLNPKKWEQGSLRVVILSLLVIMFVIGCSGNWIIRNPQGSDRCLDFEATPEACQEAWDNQYFDYHAR